MTKAALRFYAELNELLDSEYRQTEFDYPLNGPVSVKHVIEASGVPHTEVALILANGSPVTFDYAVQPGDRLSIYPAFHGIKLVSMPILQPPVPLPARFILDNHLGKLAVSLRLLGFDTLYRNDYDDAELALKSSQSGRVLLTRDRRLLMRKKVVFGYCIRTRDPNQQLLDVLRRFRLLDRIQPWQRCLRCNGLIQPVEKSKIIERLEPKTKKYFHEFQMCLDCQQIYWKGSHYKSLKSYIETVREQLQSQ